MFCSNCGTQIPDGSKFCPNCGAQTGASAPVKVNEAPQNHPAPVASQPQHTNTNYQQAAPVNNGAVAPEHGKAVASMVLGIIGVVFWFFQVFSFIAVILGIIGLVLASNAKKAGNVEGVRTAGFVLSLISLIGGSLIFIACVACAGSLAAAGAATDAFY